MVAMFCVVAALSLGMSAAETSFEFLHHTAHGDVATSDGGWILAACQADAPRCEVGNDAGFAFGDGHHHHPPHNQAKALPSVIAVSGPAPVKTTTLPEDILRRHDDAEVGRPGHVPRVSARLT